MPAITFSTLPLHLHHNPIPHETIPTCHLSIQKISSIPLPMNIYACTLEHSLLTSHYGSGDCGMVILYFAANLHLQVSIYPVSFFWVLITSLGIIILVPYICLQITWCHCFNSWVVLYCVNVPHFLYPFFSWGESRLFVCRFWLLKIKLLWTYLNKCLCGIIEHLLDLFPKMV